MAPATAGDLWHHIGRAADRPVTEVAASWTDQVGFPLIDASAACEAGRTVVSLQQQRFTSLPNVPASGPWRVPVRVARGEQAQTWLLDKSQDRFELPGCDDAPIVVNAGARGFYRVRYSSELQQRLRRGFASFSAADRVALLADSFALAMAGQQDLAQHFAWLAQVPQAGGDGRAPLFAQAASQLTQLDRTLHGTPSQQGLRTAARALLAPELARLGWDEAANDDAESRRLRGVLIGALAQLGDADVTARARERWRAALMPTGKAGASRLPGSLRGAVISAVARNATAEESQALWAALRATNSEEERQLLVRALAVDADPVRAKQLLDASLAGWLPPNIATDVPAIVGNEPVHAAAAYDFTAAHWPQLAKLAGSGVFGARAWLLPGAADGLNDRAAAKRLHEDQRRLAGPTGATPAETVAAAIEVRAALREREAERLVTALASWLPAR
jgi:aminopeptidase N